MLKGWVEREGWAGGFGVCSAKFRTFMTRLHV